MTSPSANSYQNKVLYTWLKKRAMTVAHTKTRQQQNKCQKGRKVGCPSQTDVIFLVMDVLENVFVGEVLILHCHENGVCQDPDDRHSVRSRVGSELHLNTHAFRPNFIVAPFKVQRRLHRVNYFFFR